MTQPLVYDDDDFEPRPRRKKKRPREQQWIVDRYLRTWLIILLAGGGMMFVSFFVPWWRGAVHKSSDRSDLRRAQEVIVTKARWYNDYNLLQLLRNDERSAWLFGWHTGVGITAFIFSFFIIAWGIVPWFVRLLRPWAWIGFFVCMIFGLIAFILTLVWYFSAPGKDVPGVLSQTVIAGPYLLMPATLAVFIGGLLGGIFGLLAFLKNFRPQA